MIRNQIEAIVNQLTAPPGFNPPGFAYGTANELSQELDNASFPIVLLFSLKPVPKNFTLSNAINERYSIYMEFLFKTEFDEYTSQNEIYIQMANSMCNEFLVKAANFRETPSSSRFFKVHSDDKAQSLPVYNKRTVNSTGVSLSITLNSMNNTNIPLP